MTLMDGKPGTMLMDGVYQIASTKTGQHALIALERFLCIVEALNFFSAPKEQQQQALGECKESNDYKRPLPWILYIPMLYYCRLVRMVVSLVVLPFNKTVSAMAAVHYIQTLRRKLRYVKIQGCRMMANPKGQSSSLPWPIRMAINVFTWGPLLLVTFVVGLFIGDKHIYSTTGQPRSKRLLKKLKATDPSWCSTSDLLDKFAEDDDNDPNEDPDFEVKSTDLVTETEDEEDGEEEENTEPEEENGGTKEAAEGHEENNQNPDGSDHQHHRDNNHDGQSEGNQHEQQHQHHQDHHHNHHQEHHHNY